MANPIEIIKQIQEVENIWGDFIQNGPDDGFGGYVRDQYRKRCDQFANLPPWARQLSSPATGSLQRACKPYWDDQGVDGPVARQPFNGGQCEGISYNIQWSFTNTSGNTATGTALGVRGPIIGIQPLPPNQFGGVTLQIISGDESQNPRGIGTTNPANADSGQIVSIVRNDGLADECGDPPPIIEPGPNPPADPGPTPGPEPTDDPRGRPFPFIPIPDYEDPVFGPTPIEEGDDDEPNQPGNPSGGDGLPGDPDAVGGPAGSTAGGDDGEDIDFGPPPEGRVWVGAFLQATVDPRLGNIPGTGPNNTVFPTAIGNAHLIYQGGRGLSTTLRSTKGLLTRPVTSLVVNGCFIHALPGVSLTVSPVSAIICPENPCEEEDG